MDAMNLCSIESEVQLYLYTPYTTSIVLKMINHSFKSFVYPIDLPDCHQMPEQA